MKKGKLLCVLLALALLVSLCGCGAASKMANGVTSDSVAATEAGSAAGTLYTENLTGADLSSTDRKWIITMHMQTETEDLDTLLGDLNDRIEALEGYVESSSIYNGSAYSSYSRYRDASLTIRIPAQHLEDFTEQISKVSNVTSSNTDKDDITLTYVSVESRMKALQTEETRLLELMEQAETMSDLLEIEARLTEVRYELESVTSQLRVYDNQVDYATIYLNISEVTEYTPVEEQTVWQRIGSGFVSSLKGIGNFFVELFVFLLANILYLAMAAGGIWGIVFLIRRIAGKHRGKKTDS